MFDKEDYAIILVEQWIYIVSVQIIIMWWIEQTFTNIIQEQLFTSIGLGILEHMLQWLVFSLFLIIHMMLLIPCILSVILFIF